MIDERVEYTILSSQDMEDVHAWLHLSVADLLDESESNEHGAISPHRFREVATNFEGMLERFLKDFTIDRPEFDEKTRVQCIQYLMQRWSEGILFQYDVQHPILDRRE